MRMINLNWICINSNKLSQSRSTYLPFNVSSWHTKTFVYNVDASGEIMSSTSISLTVFSLIKQNEMQNILFFTKSNKSNTLPDKHKPNHFHLISFPIYIYLIVKMLFVGLYTKDVVLREKFPFKVYSKNEKYLRISSRYTFLRFHAIAFLELLLL